MKYNSGNKISASKAVRHMQLRLSAVQMSVSDVQKRAFDNTDKMIEHMRARLKAPSQQRYINTDGDTLKRWLNSFI